MRKLIYVIAAGALMMVSCNEGLSPEGQKVWNHFKEISAQFESEEAFEASFDDVDSYVEALKDWGETAAEMQNYMLEISPEQADSFEAITNRCAPVVEKANAMLKQAQELGVDPDEEDDSEEEELEE